MLEVEVYHSHYGIFASFYNSNIQAQHAFMTILYYHMMSKKHLKIL